MSSRRPLPSIRVLGGIAAAALAIMPRHVHAALQPQNKVCADMFNLANATGTTSFLNEQISALQKATAGGPGRNELTWTVTLNAPGSAGVSDFEHDIWIGTPPDINLNDGNNPFSACAFVFTDLPYNTILRANTAPSGDCTPTFDADCINALTKKAEDIANGLTSNCTPGANSNCSIAEVCPTIFTQLGSQNAIPAECVPYFDIGTNDRAWPSANVTALTSNAGDHSQDDCFITPKGNRGFTFVPTFHLTDDKKHITSNLSHNAETYDNLTATPYPIMTVFMPPANGTRSSATIVPASAQMKCLRAEHKSPESRDFVKLPAPTPVTIPGKGPALTTGAIAGIAVGAVVFVALLILAGFCFWRRRRAARDRDEATRLYGEQQPSMASKLVSSGSVTASSQSGMLSEHSSVRNASRVYEAPPDPRRSRLAELPPGAVLPPIELNGADDPREMAAHEARVRNSLMSATTAATPASAWPRDQPFQRQVYEPPLPPMPLEEHSSVGFMPPSPQPASSDYATSSHPSSSDAHASPQDHHTPLSWGSRWSSAAATQATHGTPTTREPIAPTRPPLPPIRTSVGRGWMTPVEKKEGEAF